MIRKLDKSVRQRRPPQAPGRSLHGGHGGGAAQCRDGGVLRPVRRKGEEAQGRDRGGDEEAGGIGERIAAGWLQVGRVPAGLSLRTAPGGKRTSPATPPDRREPLGIERLRRIP